MPFRSQGLKPREIQLVNKLVEANRDIEDIYWRQSDPEALTLYESLKGASAARDQMLRRFLYINGSRFDLLDENRPFVGTQPMPPGHALYPADLTRAQLDAYVAAHPEKKNEIYNPFTIVRRQGEELVGIPYHVAFSSFLEDAAKKLREAAELSDDPAFAKFLRLRADALLTDDYFQSDLAWLELKNPKFDIIFAPYETYLDDLLGVKTSYGGAVLVRNEPESQKLELYQKYVPEIQDALPLATEDLPSKRGLADAHGGDGCALPRRRPEPRLPGGGRQSAQRSAHPRAEGQQENLLQELHGRAGELRDSAGGQAGDEAGAGGQGFGRRHIWRHACCTKSRTGWGRRSRAWAASRWISARPSAPPTPDWKRPRRTWSGCSA